MRSFNPLIVAALASSASAQFFGIPAGQSAPTDIPKFSRLLAGVRTGSSNFPQRTVVAMGNTGMRRAVVASPDPPNITTSEHITQDFQVNLPPILLCQLVADQQSPDYPKQPENLLVNSPRMAPLNLCPILPELALVVLANRRETNWTFYQRLSVRKAWWSSWD
ncbi:hypothetical protein BKA65DRAFT_476889 [Rhexocercosporidium sp. MPI-PUGE-AT-0058]|nr:hypothetical protein BKA65DRAFT_476889 [Rhexocercosporidium sp. MPI-PUGE-AT-0058]